MTLIACTSNFKRPFLVGDLLISSSQARESIQLPTNTININEFLKPNNSYAVDLYQKIYIVNKNVCVALAGIVSEMTQFLKELTIRCSYYEKIEEANIREFIEEYDFKNKFTNSAFFIMLMANEETTISGKQFWYPLELWGSVKSEIFEEVYACGTGKDDFLYQASEDQKFEASTEKGNILRAVASNIGFIAKILATERISLNTINKNWGGGFETILFDGNSFIKLDQIAYVTNYSQFNEVGDIGIPIPQLILYYEYYKEVLFISSIEIKSWQNQKDNGDSIILTSNNYSANLFMAPRLDLEKGSMIELPPSFSFQTYRVALGYTIISKSNGIFAPSYFSEGPEFNVIYEDTKFIQLTLSKKRIDLIRKSAKEVYPKI